MRKAEIISIWGNDHPPIDQGWYFWTGRMFDKASEPLGWLPLPKIEDGKTS